ncbi:exosome complex component RRP41 [Tetranychus urticae]|uniref:Putative exosome complex component RRP41 n=1 Tax=Tetranychus urticae TaxID=32264 RepID=T1KIF5_TETUR|nr:exosome complex component RRP41 [Tetranychus urticae]
MESRILLESTSVKTPFRIDGRKPHEVRSLTCRLGVFQQADGSSYVKLGNTQVLATVYGPHDTRGKSNPEKSIINCKFRLSTFSKSTRRNLHRDIRSIEISNNLTQVFDSAILTELYPHSQIDIYLEVVQSDGSDYAACINAASLAIIDAGIPIKDVVCACSAGFIDNQPITDINAVEESSNGTPILTIGMLPKDKQILSMESSGGIHLDNLNDVMDAAIEGCKSVLFIMKQTILNHIQELKD